MGCLVFLLRLLVNALILSIHFGDAQRVEQDYENYQEFAVVEGRKRITIVHYCHNYTKQSSFFWKLSTKKTKTKNKPSSLSFSLSLSVSPSRNFNIRIVQSMASFRQFSIWQQMHWFTRMLPVVSTIVKFIANWWSMFSTGSYLINITFFSGSILLHFFMGTHENFLIALIKLSLSFPISLLYFDVLFE